MNPASYSIDIHRLALHGDGVGRIACEGDRKGKAAFVPYSLPAETIQGQCAVEKKTYLRCIPHHIVKSSPDRIRPACPYHFAPPRGGLWCGGCNWQHMKLEKQREAKKGLVLETLHRLGRISEAVTIDCLHGENGWRYRNTGQFVFGRRAEETIAGFYAPGSHDIVPIEDCLIQSDTAVRILSTVRQILPELDLKPYERKNDRGWLKHLLIRSNEEGEALITLITSDARFPRREQLIRIMTEKCPEITGIFQNVQPSRTSIITGRKWIHLWGNRRLKERTCGLTLATSPGSFLQVNTGAAQLLYQRSLQEAQLQPDMTVLDLYCGAGALALLAARSAGRVIGVDELDSAIGDARENARANGMNGATFHSLSAERFLSRADLQKMLPGERAVVFIDPPRAGCQKEVIEGLLSLSPLRIIYLSCNPATLARDLEALSGNYHLVSLAAVDLFPQTSHIETIARLERKSH